MSPCDCTTPGNSVRRSHGPRHQLRRAGGSLQAYQELIQLLVLRQGEHLHGLLLHNHEDRGRTRAQPSAATALQSPHPLAICEHAAGHCSAGVTFGLTGEKDAVEVRLASQSNL